MNDKQVKSLLRNKEVGIHSAGNGLYLRVNDKGLGFWFVRYSIFKKRREMSIGQYPQVSLADAAGNAATIKQGLKDNVDPLAEKARLTQKKFNTVDDLAEDWLGDCTKRLKHPKIPRQVYRDYISPSMGALPLDKVEPTDVRAVIARVAKLGRKARANDVLMYCKQLFRHGVKLNAMSWNPASPFTIDDAGGAEESRDRALSLEELEQAFECLRNNSDQFSRENYLAVALLLMLGVRKMELVSAKWSEFDSANAVWHLPKDRSKTEVAITIPLPALALKYLKELYIRANGSEYLFPNRRAHKAKQRFPHMSPDTINTALKKLFTQDKMPVEHFTIHDLRRTCRSLLASLRVPDHVAERCMNHKLKGVIGTYNRYDYLDERREAFDQLSLLLEPVLNKVSDQILF